jgi:hypothetical protein
MTAAILKWTIVILSMVNTGYMTYDGARALVTGDYLRPKDGEYAGQLGPWSKLAEKAGIDPMSTWMKLIFLLSGIIGLVVTVCFALDLSWTWKAMLIFNICMMWNLFIGTGSSMIQIILLMILRIVR